MTTWNLVHVLLWAGHGEARRGSWNSVFLYGKHFAFTWDRASLGSELDFSVLRYYRQGYPEYRLVFLLCRKRRFDSGLPAGLCVTVFLSVCAARYWSSTTSGCFTHHHAWHHPMWTALSGARLDVTQDAYKLMRLRIQHSNLTLYILLCIEN